MTVNRARGGRSLGDGRLCFDRWRLGASATRDGARRRAPPVTAATKAAAMKGKRGEERGKRQGEKERGVQGGNIQGTNGLTICCLTPKYQSLRGVCIYISNHRVSTVPAAPGQIWKVKAACRYLLSEIESPQRTEPCWQVSSGPSQLYLIGPITTCRTILQTIQRAVSQCPSPAIHRWRPRPRPCLQPFQHRSSWIYLTASLQSLWI